MIHRTIAALAVVPAIAIVGAFCPSAGTHMSIQSTPPHTSQCLAAREHDTCTEQDADTHDTSSRRSFMAGIGASILAMTTVPTTASAEVDCFKDCFKSCKQIAPKDPDYCTQNCRDYCAQDDRKDGLSGSVSSEGGETGILGTYTVVKVRYITYGYWLWLLLRCCYLLGILDWVLSFPSRADIAYSCVAVPISNVYYMCKSLILPPFSILTCYQNCRAKISLLKSRYQASTLAAAKARS